MNQGGNEIGAAYVGAGVQKHGGQGTGENTGHQRSNDDAGAVVGGVDHSRKVKLLQNDEENGKQTHPCKSPDSQRFTDFTVYCNGKGDVHQKVQIAHAQAGDVLENGTQTAESGRGEVVGENEDSKV